MKLKRIIFASYSIPIWIQVNRFCIFDSMKNESNQTLKFGPPFKLPNSRCYLRPRILLISAFGPLIRPHPIVLGNVWATFGVGRNFCGSINLEQILPFSAIFQPLSGLKQISSTIKSTFS